VNPERLCQEATAYKYAFLGGIVGPSEVVAWADQWILMLDELPEALIEVSCSSKRINEMYTALDQLSEPKISTSALALICQMLKKWLERHPDKCGTVIELLCQSSRDGEVSLDVQSQINDLYHRHDLAQVYQEYLSPEYYSWRQQMRVFRVLSWRERWRICRAVFSQKWVNGRRPENQAASRQETIADVERDLLAFLDHHSNGPALPPGML
jgi:hypothetical protein